MLTCREVSALATEYMEGRLPWLRRLQVRLHLSMCRFCERYVRQLKLTRDVLRQLPRPGLPAGTRERLRQVFRAWQEERQDEKEDQL